MLIAQLTDCHMVEPGGLVADRVDPGPALEQAVATIGRFDVDLVVGTGDLVNDGRAEQYDRLEALLAPLRAPFLPLPGNHDDRSELRRRWPALPDGAPEVPIDHVVDDLDVRLVLLDTTIPGRHDGAFRAEQSEWLDAVLSAAPDRPTLIFQHHPPFPSGIPFMDRTCGFDGGDREAAVVARHDHVLGVHCGHLHRSIQRRFGATLAACWPSSTVELELDLLEDRVAYCGDPPAIVLHHLMPDGVVNSHAVPTGDHTAWTPAWGDDA